MDDNGLPTRGLSGWAGYALGRMSAERDRSTEKLMDALSRRGAPAINVADVLAQNRALAAENAKLRHSLDEYKSNYDELNRWATEAEATIKSLRKQVR